MPSERNKRIAKNTLMLYFRQVLVLFVSLYTVRVVLNVLGVEDYGIYSVVASLVAISSFLPGSLASSTQRFFSFALGEDNKDKLNKTFSVNLILYGAIALIAFMFLETLGLWFVNQHLALPVERVDTAHTLYQLSILIFVASVFRSPFMAIIIAHEDMKIYAYASILEVLMKLGVVFLLMYLPWDKLELYGVLLLGVACINSATYIGFCLIKYEECQFRKFHWDASLLREIVGFTGWTVFGQITSVARTNAITVLLNQMFNPVVVAARAIAVNVASNINLFSNNFNFGLYPPIIKSYAAGNKEEMFSLISNGSKITFFLMWLFALPMLLETEYILNMWLKNVPTYAVIFAQLALIESIIMSLSLPIATAARAPGKMRLYELTLGSIQIALFLCAWLVLSLGAPAYSVFLVAIVANLVMFVIRLLIVRVLIGFQILPFFKSVVFPVVGIVVCSSLPVLIVRQALPSGFVYVVLTIFMCLLSSLLSMYFIGLDKVWREKAVIMIKSRLLRGKQA